MSKKHVYVNPENFGVFYGDEYFAPGAEVVGEKYAKAARPFGPLVKKESAAAVIFQNVAQAPVSSHVATPDTLTTPGEEAATKADNVRERIAFAFLDLKLTEEAITEAETIVRRIRAGDSDIDVPTQWLPYVEELTQLADVDPTSIQFQTAGSDADAIKTDEDLRNAYSTDTPASSTTIDNDRDTARAENDAPVAKKSPRLLPKSFTKGQQAAKKSKRK